MSGNNLDDNGIDDNDFVDDSCKENNEKNVEIQTVWSHPLIQRYKKNGKQYWKCNAKGCEKSYFSWNSTKAMCHGARVKQYCLQHNIKRCQGTVTKQELELFQNLLYRYLEKKNVRKRVST